MDATQALSNELMQGENISTDDLEAQANSLVQQANAVMGGGQAPAQGSDAPPNDSKVEIAQLVGKLKELTGADPTLGQAEDPNMLIIGN